MIERERHKEVVSVKIWRVLRGILLLSFVSALFAGCGLMGGNALADIQEAVKTVENRYGITLTIRKKALFPGGATCDVITRCKELPDRDIRVFRFDKSTPVQSDYIYQKYGDEAYDKICSVVHTIYPEALVVVEDSNYNHFTNDWYDGNTSIEDYLLDNQLRVNIALLKVFDEEELLKEYHRMAETLFDAGINSYGLGIYCMKNPDAFDEIKTYDHIPDHQAYEGIPANGVWISANNNYGRIRDYLEDPESSGIAVSHGIPE